MNCTSILCLLAIQMIFTSMYSQVNLEERILNQVTTQIGNNGEFLNSSNLSLELNEKQAYDIAIDILKIKYGRKQIRKQKPHNKIKHNQYWIFYGSLPIAKKGGVFTIAINQINGKVEYLSHGR